MDRTIKEFVEKDKEWMGKIWQKEQNILGSAKQLKQSIESNILVLTHPIGTEMMKTLDILIEEEESKIEVIEERMDEYEDILEE